MTTIATKIPIEIKARAAAVAKPPACELVGAFADGA